MTSATTVFSDHVADVMAVAVNPQDPNIFATGSCDKTVRVWDVRRPRSVRTFEGHSSDVNDVAFFPSALTQGAAVTVVDRAADTVVVAHGAAAAE